MARTDLPMYVAEARGYECGRFGSKLANPTAKSVTHVSAEDLHAARATHPGILVVARRTVCGVGYNVRACDHAVFPCRR